MWSSGRTLILGLAACLGLADPAAAYAIDLGEMNGLTLNGCGALDANQVRDLLASELLVMGYIGPTWPSVAVTCSGAEVQIAVKGANAAKARSVDLGVYSANSRARFLATEISVLLSQVGEQAHPEDKPPTSPERLHPVTPTTSPLRTSIEVFTILTRMGRPKILGSSIGLGFRWSLRSWWHFAGDLRGTFASWSLASGQVNGRDVSVGLSALFGRAVGITWLGVGPGLRGGRIWLEGATRVAGVRNQTFSDHWWGPTATTVATFRVSTRWRIRAFAEAGAVIRAVEGFDETHRTVGQGGYWVSIGAGGGIAF